MDWENVFQYVDKELPATDNDITYLQEFVLSPLTEEEISEINIQQQLRQAFDCEEC